jgi:hypothetical protein
MGVDLHDLTRKFFREMIILIESPTSTDEEIREEIINLRDKMQDNCVVKVTEGIKILKDFDNTIKHKTSIEFNINVTLLDSWLHSSAFGVDRKLIKKNLSTPETQRKLLFYKSDTQLNKLGECVNEIISKYGQKIEESRKHYKELYENECKRGEQKDGTPYIPVGKVSLTSYNLWYNCNPGSGGKHPCKLIISGCDTFRTAHTVTQKIKEPLGIDRSKTYSRIAQLACVITWTLVIKFHFNDKSEKSMWVYLGAMFHGLVLLLFEWFEAVHIFRFPLNIENIPDCSNSCCDCSPLWSGILFLRLLGVRVIHRA